MPSEHENFLEISDLRIYGKHGGSYFFHRNTGTTGTTGTRIFLIFKKYLVIRNTEMRILPKPSKFAKFDRRPMAVSDGEEEELRQHEGGGPKRPKQPKQSPS